jgi:hypothetical protein
MDKQTPLRKRTATTALCVAFVFGTVMVLDPKEDVDNPHTHQERPSAPTLDSQPAIVSTLTGTQAMISPGFGPHVPV